MFPTIDNVEEYLESKQWDKLQKEYEKYKSLIVSSSEDNVVIDMVPLSLPHQQIKSHMMEYIEKAINELLALLYNSNSGLSPEQQTHYIQLVIALDYPHVPELFMLQNTLQTWKTAVQFKKERLRKYDCGETPMKCLRAGAHRHRTCQRRHTSTGGGETPPPVLCGIGGEVSRGDEEGSGRFLRGRFGEK